MFELPTLLNVSFLFVSLPVCYMRPLMYIFHNPLLSQVPQICSHLFIAICFTVAMKLWYSSLLKLIWSLVSHISIRKYCSFIKCITLFGAIVSFSFKKKHTDKVLNSFGFMSFLWWCISFESIREVKEISKEKIEKWKYVQSEQEAEALREKCSNTKFFSGPYFPVFSPNTGKYGPEKTPYLDAFHAV